MSPRSCQAWHQVGGAAARQLRYMYRARCTLPHALNRVLGPPPILATCSLRLPSLLRRPCWMAIRRAAGNNKGRQDPKRKKHIIKILPPSRIPLFNLRPNLNHCATNRREYATTSAYVRVRVRQALLLLYLSHTSANVSILQHASASAYARRSSSFSTSSHCSLVGTRLILS